ncbi:hypothetical protein FRC03_005908, partial [Tulasnella sp. 419]
MELLSTVCLGIDLVNKIKAAFDQAGQGSHECAVLCSETSKSFLIIKDFCEQHALYLPTKLLERLVEFDMELKLTIDALEALMNSTGVDCLASTPPELQNMGDIKDELISLQIRVQRYEQELQ